MKNTNLKGVVSWQSPANIAFIKYWGKYGIQFPHNPSLSMGLSNCFSETTIEYTPRNIEQKWINFSFEGELNQIFEKKIINFINIVSKYIPCLKKINLNIRSNNNFPHSIGIASSASSISSLALGLCDLEKIYKGEIEAKHNNYFFQKASKIARFGSGSACRSVYSGLVLWGKTTLINTSSQEYAIQLNLKNNYIIDNLNDAVLIVDPFPKALSSSAGHYLMQNNSYRNIKFKESNKNLLLLISAIEKNNISSFIEILEKEALSLHAMLMTSSPYEILLSPKSIYIIEKIRKFRNKESLNFGFTIDAGSTVHIIYSDIEKAKVEYFLNNEVKELCESKKIIFNTLGAGPKKKL